MDTDQKPSLSTGMSNLDNKLSNGGFVPGTLLAVQSDPAALGQVVLYNLAAGRPTLYVSVGPRSDETLKAITSAGNLDRGDLVIEELPASSPVESMLGLLDGLALPQRATVLVEPTNALESRATDGQYAEILADLVASVRDVHGLCALLTLTSDEVPANRWQTLHHADTVLTIVHEVSSRNVHDHLALEKLHPRQQLRDAEDRVFRLPRSLEMDVDTKKNISP